jgi:hypothetical protein
MVYKKLLLIYIGLIYITDPKPPTLRGETTPGILEALATTWCKAPNQGVDGTFL